MLRIPMRGYEATAKELFPDLFELRIPMRGYEVSDCPEQIPVSCLLRIPMRVSGLQSRSFSVNCWHSATHAARLAALRSSISVPANANS